MTSQYQPTCCERNLATSTDFDEFRCHECGKDYRLSARHAGANLIHVWEYVEADHTEDAVELRKHATALRDAGQPHDAGDFEAAAQLLEVHITTGINLRTFGAVGDFVDRQLAGIGRGPVTDNGA